MTSISQDSGDVAGDIKLSITGTGFTNEDDTLIQIGDKLMICQPTSMSAILINCTVQQPEAGIYSVYVFTKKGNDAMMRVRVVSCLKALTQGTKPQTLVNNHSRNKTHTEIDEVWKVMYTFPGICWQK